MSDSPFDILIRLWNNGAPDVRKAKSIPSELRVAIVRATNAQFKLIRYILPSQLLAKLVDPDRNALALQVQSQLPGSFDARSFCKAYITRFDEENHGVLGGSEDPGVGNIWRYPQIDAHWLGIGRRRKSGGDDLAAVLKYAQDNPAKVEILLRLTLAEIAVRLAQTKIVYPRPNRISITTCETLIRTFLDARSGGRRLQIVAAALFDCIGRQFSLFHDVEVGHINKADASRNDVGDLNCRDVKGNTVLAVEVKDRDLSVREVTDTLRIARDRGVAEIVFIIRGVVPALERAEYDRLQAAQFNSGHNIYDVHFDQMLHASLILFGESGRLKLLEAIAGRIDAMGELIDRQAWQLALQSS